MIDPTEATPPGAEGHFDAHDKQDPITVDMTGWTSLGLGDFLRWSNCITDFCLITPSSTRQIADHSGFRMANRPRPWWGYGQLYIGLYVMFMMGRTITIRRC